jgi:hypothetical protein
MAENYYIEPNRNIPNVFESHVATVIEHVAASLFTDEFIKNKQKAYNRILLSDVNSGNTINIGDSYQFFQSMNDNYPFVAYNIGSVSIPSDYGISQSHTIGNQYIEELNAYVRTYPMDFEIQFIAFFNDSLDHRKAMSLIQSNAFGLTRLFSKVMFDNIEVRLPLTLKTQIDKGELLYELEQYLIQNRIWNFNFTYTGRYYEYLFDEIIVPNSSEKTLYDVTNIYNENKYVQRVDDVEINIFGENKNAIIDTKIIPDQLKILSIFPLNNAINVSLGSTISITFNKAIVPNSFIESFILNPDIECEIYYSIDYKIANIKPISILGFDSKKNYKVIVTKDLKDLDNIFLSENYNFSFTTI